MSKKNGQLEIIDLHIKADKKQIVKGISLEINKGEIHAVMGPNGSGKSTLLNAIMGHPRFEITKGSIKLNNRKLNELAVNKRANLGLFMAFQHPTEISGLSLGNFLRLARNENLKISGKDTVKPAKFLELVKNKAKLLKINEKFILREINKGFSGGEKKKAEILQMALLEPKFALIDEIDSGLDIDALKIVAYGIKKINEEQKTGILLVTHYQRILNYITPDFVHIISGGKIVKSGGKHLAKTLEKEGYEKYLTA